MLKKRLIPVLLLRNGKLVRSESFKIHQIIGDPIHEVDRFNQWNVDELIYLDITREGAYDDHRPDHKIRGFTDSLTILDAVSKTCFMPLTWGGRIINVEDMCKRINRGADKITINTAAYRSPQLIEQGARTLGSQAIVVSIDAVRHDDNTLAVVIDGGRERTAREPADWAKEVEARGAGEILLQSVDRDGKGTGYDLDLISSVASAVSIPVIACSGVGVYEQYAAGIEAGASAVAAANIWHFKELSDRNAKRALARAGVDVRI